MASRDLGKDGADEIGDGIPLSETQARHASFAGNPGPRQTLAAQGCSIGCCRHSAGELVVAVPVPVPVPEAEAEAGAGEQERSHHQLQPITKVGLLSLLAQHTSSSWNARTCEFAFYLYLIESFPDTLLPASIYGLFCTGASILLAGWIGGLVDGTRRVRIVRLFTLVQKASIMTLCAAFLGLFIDTKPARYGDYRDAPPRAWAAFVVIVLGGCALSLANIGITVAVERDWVTQISGAADVGDDGKKETLTRLNTYMRRIDLLCKLLSPLFISLLTSTASYTFSVAFVMAFAALTLIFELWWINVVFLRFPSLSINQGGNPVNSSHTTDTTSLAATDEAAASEPARSTHGCNGLEDLAVSSPPVESRYRGKALSLQRFRSIVQDWKDFSHLAVFPSTVSISLLYLTVLSFDGTMLSYLKTRNYSDAFIAGQRGLCVVTGLLGTIMMPWLERKLGLIRAGAWSIVSEALSLAPVLASFFVPMSPSANGPAWSATLLFGGMAASRIGLWAFDLCQLKELQLALDEHPRRNRFMGLQISLQNVADLAKYVVTLILSQPRQFRWAALVSFCSVCLAVGFYAIFVKRERKHLFHPEWIPLLRKNT